MARPHDVELQTYDGENEREARRAYDADVAKWHAAGWRPLDEQWTGRHLLVTYVARPGNHRTSTQRDVNAEAYDAADHEAVIPPALALAALIFIIAVFVLLWIAYHPL
jgi:hypothetical protein